MRVLDHRFVSNGMGNEAWKQSQFGCGFSKLKKCDS